MIRILTALLVICTFPFFAKAQNLIPNGNFETYTTCPSAFSQVSNCTGWASWNTTGSPDYYNTCYTGTSGPSIPTSIVGYQWPANGNGYMGLYGHTATGVKEYPTCAIPALQVGMTYEISMSVSLANFSSGGTNDIAVFFFDQGPTIFNGIGLAPISPKVDWSNIVITDTQNWVRLSKTFIADSAYDNIAIGGSRGASNITFVPVNNNSGMAYYLVDSIVLTLYDSLSFAFTDTAKCSGDTLKIIYASSRKKQSNNVFILQLSNSSGSFSGPVNIGTYASDTSGMITAVIPANTATGTGYKLRLVATNFPDTSENSIAFKIGNGLSKPIAGNNSPVCNNDTLKFTATTSTSGVTWSWTGPNNFASGLQNPMIPNPVPADGGNYIVTAKLYGCSAKDTTNAVVLNGNGPDNPLAASNTPICADDTLKLFGTANGTGLSYSWTGPNSFTSNQQNVLLPLATTAFSGNYILYVNNSNCITRDTVTVLVKPRPANFNAVYNSPVCTGNPLNFTASSTSSGVTYAWTGPNSFSSTSATPTIGGSSSVHNGDYIATATLNGCSLKDTVTVSVKPLPAKPDANNNGPLCAGSVLNLTATSSTSGVGWSWVGPNSYASSAQNPSLGSSTVAMSGEYIVTADLNGCSLKDTTTVLVKPLPAAVTLSSNSPLCAGSNIMLFSTASTTGATYAWTGPGAFSASTLNAAVTGASVGASGWYKMTVDLNGCTYKDSTSVTVHPIPTMPVASYVNPLCVGETLQLNTSAIAGATYSWTGPGGFSSSLRNPTRGSMQFGDTGKYDVTVTVNGCTSPIGNTTVNINPNPFVVILANPGDSICQGNPVVFTAYPNNHAGSPTYQWYVNMQAAGTGTVFNSSALNHNDVVRCDMTEYTRCSVPYKDESNDITMTVLSWKAPSVSISAVPMQPLKPNEYITFTAVPVDAGLLPKYQWKRNGQNVVGATGSIWSANTLNDNDEICVEVTSTYKCPQPLTAKSNCIKVKVLSGVNDADGSSSVMVFPNPNNGNFSIKGYAGTNGVVTMNVVNYLGQSVYSLTTQPHLGQIDTHIELQNVTKGIYLLRLQTDIATQQVKLMIQ